MSDLSEFTEKAQGLSKNPMGIISLFISLIYGFACIIMGISLNNLHGGYERLPLIWFVIGFPILILAVFVFLVVKYPNHLYGPADYKDEKNFIDNIGYKSVSSSLEKATSQLKTLSAVLNDEKLTAVLSDITGELTATNERIKQQYEQIPINNLWQLNHWGGACVSLQGEYLFFNGLTVPKGTDGAHINLRNFLQIGETYKITCFAKSDPGTTAKIELWCHDNTGAKQFGIDLHSKFQTPSTSGDVITLFFRANFNNDLRIHIQYQPGEGRIEVSDVKIYKETLSI